MKPIVLILMSLVGSPLLAADYEVPVPSELAPYARFEPTEASAEIRDNKLVARYRLPSGLVGTEAPLLEFSGATGSSFINVRGTGVYGVCMTSEVKPMACMLRYPGLVIDEVSRDRALKDLFNGAELIHREEVARLFNQDPAGILSVTLSGQ